MNLSFSLKDLPLPTQGTSYYFQVHQIVTPPLPSLTHNINRNKGFLFTCWITLIEDKAQALMANESWDSGTRFLTIFWMWCLQIQEVVCIHNLCFTITGYQWKDTCYIFHKSTASKLWATENSDTAPVHRSSLNAAICSCKKMFSSDFHIWHIIKGA